MQKETTGNLDVCKTRLFRMEPRNRCEVYRSVPSCVHENTVSMLLMCPSSPLEMYTQNQYILSDELFMHLYDLVMEKEAIVLVATLFITACRYGLCISLYFNTRVTQFRDLYIIIPLYPNTDRLLNPEYMVSHLHGCCLYMALEFL